MSVITFASLKGGVGKTSLAVNIADAFAHRGCAVLIIDLDPAAHASRLFRTPELSALFPAHSPLAQNFLSRASEDGESYENLIGGKDECAFVVPVRESLELIPATPDLRYFIPAQGAKYFARHFAPLIEHLKPHFDHIVIDTPPDFNVLSRNAIAVSDMVVSPIDTSEMGIHSAEELLKCAEHIKRPVWALVRTMVNSRAQRSQVLTNSRLGANLVLQNPSSGEPVPNFSDNRDFVQLLEGWQLAQDIGLPSQQKSARLIYLLDAMTYRTEVQNQLTFLGRTAFDLKKTNSLARQYLAVARELEEILSGLEDDEEVFSPPLSDRLEKVAVGSN